jgi:hypothetical protein
LNSQILHAAIGSRESIDELSDRWILAHAIYLPQNFAMIPFIAELYDDINELIDLSDPDPYAEFDRLSASAESLFREASRFGRLGYIEINYVDGCGTQSAIAWDNGKILLGALTSETTWNSEGYAETSTGKSAIDRVLSVLGVWTNRSKSEFEMLCLNDFRFRDTEQIGK